ncbi:MAG: 16S rRNA methyltransferase [Persephonella sp.]|nr:MAG: 16S rRNA methyltransferase [Persephonella sp.]
MAKFRTKKSLGQHLLISEGVIKKIVDYIDVNNEDVIVEIGVGTGQLTEEILRRNPKKLYGIEIDERVYPIVEERLKEYSNFILIKKDYFDVNLREFYEDDKIKIVGNLPYNVASLILIDTAFYIDIIRFNIFMIQKEVAEKLVAKPKTKSYSFMSVFLQTFFNTKYLMSVPPRFFSPPPKVISAVVKLSPKEKLPIPFDKIKDYKKFVSDMFSHRRKMLKSKINPNILEMANIKPTARAEELSVEDFIRLFNVYFVNINALNIQ